MPYKHAPEQPATDRDERHRRLLRKALQRNGGARDWRGWKAGSIEEFMAMVAKAPRMTVLELSLDGDLDIAYRIEMPVPRWPVDGRLRIGDHAVFHLHYEDSWRWEPFPGWAPVGLFHPLDPFHPNCRPHFRGAICLGVVPPATKPTELVLLGFYTLCLQTVSLDETDPLGVLNVEACQFYRDHPEYVPLSRAGLFEPLEEVSPAGHPYPRS